jgi:hypothetical protein
VRKGWQVVSATLISCWRFFFGSDCRKAIELKPDFSKAYSRLGTAHFQVSPPFFAPCVFICMRCVCICVHICMFVHARTPVAATTYYKTKIKIK